MSKPTPLPVMKAAMEAKGLTVPKLAEKANRSAVQIWRVLHNKSRPSPELAIELETHLGPHFHRSDARPDLWPKADVA